MIRMKSYIFCFLLCPVILGLASCVSSQDDGDRVWKTKEDKIISEWLQAKPELSISLEALKKTYVFNTISTYGPYTFFVPNNNAWTNYFSSHNYSSLQDVNVSTLEDIFEYHILPVKKMSDVFQNGIMNDVDTTINGDRLLLDISKGLDQVVVNNRAEIVESDIEAWNGVIHVMDEVLEPPTMTVGEYLEVNPHFSKFVSFLKENDIFDTLTYRRLPVYPYSRNEFTVMALTNSQMDKLQPYIDSLKIVDELYDEKIAIDPDYVNRVMPNQVRELAGSFIISGLVFTSTAYSGFKKTLGRVPYGDGSMRMKMVVKDNQITINDQAVINNDSSDFILKNGLVDLVDTNFGCLAESPRDIIYSAYPIERWNTTEGATVTVNNGSNGYMGDNSNVYGIVNLEPKIIGSEFWVVIPNVPAGKYNMTLILKKQGSKTKILVDGKMLEFLGTESDGSYDFSLLLGSRGTADDLHKTSLSSTGLYLFEVSTGNFVVQKGQKSVSVRFSTTYLNPSGSKIAVSAIVLEPYAE